MPLNVGRDPISEQAASVRPVGDSYLVRTAYGQYRISRSAIEDMPATLTNKVDRAKLITRIINDGRGGKDLWVNTDLLLAVKSWPRLSIAQRVERIPLFLEQALSSIDSSLPWDLNVSKTEKDALSAEEARTALRAWTESTSDREIAKLLEYVSQQGLVAAGQRLSLTIAGWQHLEQMRQAGAAYDQAFVAMWFSSEMDEVYSKGIEPAIRDCGYRPLIIRAKEHNNKIDDEIIAEIRRSRFVVADFTCGKFDSGGTTYAVPRGGVYYEAGFAKGLGLEVIWTVRDDLINDVHFDTRQFNHIVWSSPSDLREKLTNRIGAVLGHGPLNAAI